MILLGLGSNLDSVFGDSSQTVEAALQQLDEGAVRLVVRSRLWLTRPVPVSDQPWFVNAAALIETTLPPADLLLHLHAIEHRFGRLRHEVNAPRSLDLDIIDYDGIVSQLGARPVLPHPRLADRAFVLKPLADIAPDWQHPVSGSTLAALIAALPPDQIARPADG